MKQSTLFIAALVLVSLASTTFAHEGIFIASSDVVLDTPTKAKRIIDPVPVAPVAILEDNDLIGSCSLVAKNNGNGRKGIRATFTALLVDATTSATIRDLGKVTGKTNKEGLLTVDLPIARQANFAQLVALATEINIKGGKKITSATFSCTIIDPDPDPSS